MSENFITIEKREELAKLEREIQELSRHVVSGCFTPRTVAMKLEEIERKLSFIDPSVDKVLHAKVTSDHTTAVVLYTRLTEKDD